MTRTMCQNVRRYLLLQRTIERFNLIFLLKIMHLLRTQNSGSHGELEFLLIGPGSKLENLLLIIQAFLNYAYFICKINVGQKPLLVFCEFSSTSTVFSMAGIGNTLT